MGYSIEMITKDMLSVLGVVGLTLKLMKWEKSDPDKKVLFMFNFSQYWKYC